MAKKPVHKGKTERKKASDAADPLSIWYQQLMEEQEALRRLLNALKNSNAEGSAAPDRDIQ